MSTETALHANILFNSETLPAIVVAEHTYSEGDRETGEAKGHAVHWAHIEASDRLRQEFDKAYCSAESGGIDIEIFVEIYGCLIDDFKGLPATLDAFLDSDTRQLAVAWSLSGQRLLDAIGEILDERLKYEKAI